MGARSKCRTVEAFVLAASLLALSGCATASLRNPVPPALAENAQVRGFAKARFWFDEHLDKPDEALRQLGLRQLSETSTNAEGRPIASYLALSGGADDGAYGAGLLVGWSATGKRPSFDVVTGISAGALIAPFAFLGRDYDPQLRAMWLNYTSDDLYRSDPLDGLLGGPALADSSPLAELIAKYVDRRLLAATAREYRKGRLLLIGTTNLDTQRLAIWNMGEIASSNHAGALQLFRQILLASTAVPGLFPPVRINVAAAGYEHEELHVDGGVSTQVFLLPVNVSFRDLDKLHPSPPQHRIFVIRNAKLAPAYNAVPASLFPISERSLSTLILNQSLADVQRIYLQSLRDGGDYNLACIPNTFSHPHAQPFDRSYMAALFELGFTQAEHGSPWMKTPPGLPSGSGMWARSALR
jgi:predicted acylesterase/phospholipase RssA